MSTVTKSIAILALLVTTACTNPDRFADGSGLGSGEINNGGGLSDPNAINQSNLDPSSPQYFNQTVGNRVLFAVDQSTVSAEGAAVLDGQASWLAQNPSYIAVIEGHADEQGTREYNLALGARRSNAVREYLSARGVAGSRIQTVSFGKERPIELCSRESCYSVNRRAVTLLDNLGS